MDPAIHYAARFGLALLFAAAALHKWRTRKDFAATVAAYELLPAVFVRPFAGLLPFVEFAIAGGLVVGIAKPLPAIAAAALLGLYALAIGYNLLRDRADIDCGCLSSAARTPLSTALLWRNAALIVIAIVSAMPPSSRILTPMDVVAVAGSVITAAMFFLAADVAGANERHTERLLARR